VGGAPRWHFTLVSQDAFRAPVTVLLPVALAMPRTIEYAAESCPSIFVMVLADQGFGSTLPSSLLISMLAGLGVVLQRLHVALCLSHLISMFLSRGVCGLPKHHMPTAACLGGNKGMSASLCHSQSWQRLERSVCVCLDKQHWFPALIYGCEQQVDTGICTKIGQCPELGT
jgi:hypothetical protein